MFRREHIYLNAKNAFTIWANFHNENFPSWLDLHSAQVWRSLYAYEHIALVPFRRLFMRRVNLGWYRSLYTVRTLCVGEWTAAYPWIMPSYVEDCHLFPHIQRFPSPWKLYSLVVSPSSSPTLNISLSHYNAHIYTVDSFSRLRTVRLCEMNIHLTRLSCLQRGGELWVIYSFTWRRRHYWPSWIINGIVLTCFLYGGWVYFGRKYHIVSRVWVINGYR